MVYTICLLDRTGQVVAQEPLWAQDHFEAHEAGFLILESCKDVAHAYEVWCDGALIGQGRRRRGLFDLGSVIEARQNNIIEVEDRLNRGFTAIAKSRRLLRATEKLRQRGLL